MKHILNYANALSFLRILLTPFFIRLLFKGDGYIGLSLIVFTIAALTDTCDGYIARRFGLVSELGAFLDPIADKVFILGTFIAFWYLGVISLWFVILLLVRDFIVTLLRSIMIRSGKSFKTSRLGKWKTVFQFIVIYLLFACQIIEKSKYIALGSLLVNIVDLVVFVVAILTVYSAFDYFKKYWIFLSKRS